MKPEPRRLPRGCNLFWDLSFDTGSTIYDRSGQATGDGVVVGATLIPGPTGLVRWYDGTDDTIYCPNGSIQGSTEHTFAAWVANTMDAPWSHFVGYVGTLDLNLGTLEDGKLSLVSADAAIMTTVEEPFLFGDGTWRHIAHTYDAVRGNLIYIDGEVAPVAAPDAVDYAGAYRCAYFAGFAGAPFGGAIGEAFHCNLALGAGEISRYYLESCKKFFGSVL